MISLVLALVVGQGYFTPEEAQQLLSSANAAYYRDDLAAAIDGYQKLLERGMSGPDVLYNLGTAYLEQGKLGEAVFYLERARRAGGGEDVDANLALALTRQVDQVVGSRQDTFLQRVAHATDAPWVTVSFLVLWGAGFGALIVRGFSRRRRTAAAVAAGVCLGLASVTGALVAVQAYVHATITEGVVLAETLPAHEAPRAESKVAFEVHAGLKVRLVERAGRFVKLRLPNGLEGWAEREGLAEL